MHGVGHLDDAELAGVGAENARERVGEARVRLVACRDAVGSDDHTRVAHDEAHVVFVHGVEDHDAGATERGHDRFRHRLVGEVVLVRQFGERTTLPLGPTGRGGDQHLVAAQTAER